VGSYESCSGDCGRGMIGLYSFDQMDQTKATRRCSRATYPSHRAYLILTSSFQLDDSASFDHGTQARGTTDTNLALKDPTLTKRLRMHRAK
jgi:hypothetical protein